MSEKLTREEFWEAGDFSTMGNEEWVRMDAIWKRIEADRDTIRAEVRKEVTEEILKDHFKIGEKVEVEWPGGKWELTEIIPKSLCNYTSRHPNVRRPPKPRPMTDDEIVKALIDAGVTYLGMFSRLTHDAMARDLGIPTEVTE